jgi:hypothetical protein
MQIVELTDYSMVIMRDSTDPPWVSLGKTYSWAKKHHRGIEVGLLNTDGSGEITSIISSDMICTAGRLVLFFKDKIDSRYKLHSPVQIF